jgi:hypothetical protein
MGALLLETNMEHMIDHHFSLQKQMSFIEYNQGKSTLYHV